VAVPGLRDLFRFGVLHPDDVAVIVTAGLLAMIWLEALRLIRLRLGTGAPAASPAPAPTS
jgi:hypothetical protein